MFRSSFINHSSYEPEFKGTYYDVMKLPVLLQLIKCNFYINFVKGRWNFLSENSNKLLSETVKKKFTYLTKSVI